MPEFHVGARRVGACHPPFVIAEVGINHNGDLATALRMCEVAKESGADAVKFQTFKADEFCGDPAQTYTYVSQGQSITEPMLEMFRRYELGVHDWKAIKLHCDKIGITFFSTPQNESDLRLLLELGVPVLKIGSDDLTNTPLVRAYSRVGLPLILSSGMSDLADVERALEAADWFAGGQVALLQCTSQYPTPPGDVNILKIRTLQGAFPGLVVGFSDHTQGATAATLAVGLGARIFEKHFTLDHAMPGPDHWFSEDPGGLVRWASTIRQADEMLGSPLVRPTEVESEARSTMRRSVVALRSIDAGGQLSPENVGLRRAESGLSPNMIERIWGMSAARSIRAGEGIDIGDVQK